MAYQMCPLAAKFGTSKHIFMKSAWPYLLKQNYPKSLTRYSGYPALTNIQQLYLSSHVLMYWAYEIMSFLLRR